MPVTITFHVFGITVSIRLSKPRAKKTKMAERTQDKKTTATPEQ